VSYFIALLICAFTLGIVVGVMLESSARKYFLREKNKNGDK